MSEQKTTGKWRNVIIMTHAEAIDMGGFPVRQPLPQTGLEMVDPFLLLHHATVKIPAGSNAMTQGVGPHPHRGFSPVTFIFRGGVHHRDSRGHSSIIGEGGTQWMQAGMGIVHSERPPAALSESGGVQEIIQFWVNTPAAHKMMQPEYIPVTREATPNSTPDLGTGTIGVVAGSLGDITGPVNTLSPMTILRCTFQKGASHSFDLPDDFNALIYVLDGALKVGGYGQVEGLNLVAFERGGGSIVAEATEDTRFILLAGTPLDEPVQSYGPFVMNNQTQVMEAIRDYQMGRMGVLVEEDLK